MDTVKLLTRPAYSNCGAESLFFGGKKRLVFEITDFGGFFRVAEMRFEKAEANNFPFSAVIAYCDAHFPPLAWKFHQGDTESTEIKG